MKIGARVDPDPALLRRLPPGDREPAVRIAAGRILASLNAIESEPHPAGPEALAKRARQISRWQARLLRLVTLAKFFRLTLPPAAAERASARRKAPQ